MAGQGTMALEILEQTPDVEAMVVPVGGGGLIAGIGTVDAGARAAGRGGRRRAGRAAMPHGGDCGGKPVAVPLAPTLADGLAVAQRRRHRRLPATRRVVDQVVTVDEASIALAILRLIELEKSVVEGAGADAARGVPRRQAPHLKGRKVVLTLCGGNIDLTMLDRVIEIGLVADGRLSRFTVSIADRPGGLARLAVGDRGGRRVDQGDRHDRAFSGPELAAVRVICVVETTGPITCARCTRPCAQAGFTIVGCIARRAPRRHGRELSGSPRRRAPCRGTPSR